MTEYRVRPGIVLTKICGSYVLIPSRASLDACSSIQRLPLLWAAVWERISKGDGLEQLVEIRQIFDKRPEKEVRSTILRFCEDLTDKGFLIKDERPELRE